MKQLVFTFCLILTVGSGFAQHSEFAVMPGHFWIDFYMDRQPYWLVKERDAIKENNVKSRENIRYFKGQPLTTREYFDKNGRLTLSEVETKDGEKNTVSYKYSPTGKVLENVTKNGKGRVIKTVFEYDDKDRLLLQEKQDSKRGYSASKTVYNEQGKAVSRQIYEKSKEVPVQELTYSYYENGDRKTTEYFKKGRLIYSWKYDCKPEGELINVKRKDETMLCISEDTDPDGNRVAWERKFDEKGKLTKIKTVYTVDSLIILKQHYGGTDKLTSEVKYAYNADKKPVKKTTSCFLKDGTSYLASETVFSQEKQSKTTTYYTKKGEVQFTSYYTTDNSKIIKSQCLNGKWSHTYLYHYTETGLKKSEVRIFKNGTHVNEYVYEYYL